ncbi:MAG: hypothetical protein ASARMPREDX12_001758 [Alectoria sarmentosa]|nr:MAG: hypothetical protein ASARMPREDX12_001758 [Alectoria sarmentosa]
MLQHLTRVALLLTTAFALIALALPSPPNLIDALLPRDFPQPLGVYHGAPFEGLTFTIYAERNCKGTPAGIYTGDYGLYEAYQMQSYHLSRTLLDNEVLDFYSGTPTDLRAKNTINHNLNGHYTEACLLYDVTAGQNATTDNSADKAGKIQGCHTLNMNEWCAVIWNNSVAEMTGRRRSWMAPL